MDQKNFQKWLESVEKQISEEKIDLSGLNLSESHSEFLEKFVCSKPSDLKKSENRIPTSNVLSKATNKYKKTLEIDKKSNLSSNSQSKISMSNAEFTFNPKLNKNSILIANKLGSSHERIHAKPLKHENESVSVHSSINSDYLSNFDSNKSENISKAGSFKSKFQYSHEDVMNNVERLLEWEKAKKERQKNIEELKNINEIKNCTFQPKIKKMPQDSKCGKPMNKISHKKTGYSIKSDFSKIESQNENCEEIFQDLTESEYQFALKSLHWELSSIVLKSMF